MIKIYVDGWCAGNPGKGGWQLKIEKSNSNDLKILKKRESNYITNNLAEFYAIFDAIRWSREYIDNKPYNDEKIIIYTDSQVALSWLNNKKIKSKINCSKTQERNKKIEEWFKENFIDDITITKWETKKLGEIPADFGRKKTKFNI